VSFRIRNLEPQDLDSLIQLASGTPEAPRWSRRDYEKVLRAEPPFLRFGLVAVVGEQLAGFAVACYLAQEAAAEVESLVVAEPYRRLGIGSALVRDCMAWSAKAGAAKVRLEVRMSNAAAIALYQRQGFSAAGIRRAYYSAPTEDALLLHASL